MARRKKTKTSGAKPIVRVDIVSDIVCPWCWLGSRYFQMAVKKSPYDVELTWRPYMLDPDVPDSGVPYKDYMKAKFGGGPSDRFKAMREALEAAAPDVGIRFRFDDIPMRPNTLNAHRLMRWASGQGLSDIMAEALFAAFFDELQDIGNPEILAEIAGKVGMDAEIIAGLLAGDEDKQAVKTEIDFFKNLGVTGVPCFIYEGQFAVQGAQGVDAHLAAIQKATSLIEQ